jgi:hypothetical protein
VDGHKEWTFGGVDIFTGGLVIGDNAIDVTDYDGRRYSIDPLSGNGHLLRAG